MSSITKTTTGILLTTALALALAGCGGAQPEQPQPAPPARQEATEQPAQPETTSPEALVSERCTACHDAERIKSASKSREEWEATVRRMRQNGARLTDAEAAQVVDFLASGGAEKL